MAEQSSNTCSQPTMAGANGLDSSISKKVLQDVVSIKWADLNTVSLQQLTPRPKRNDSQRIKVKANNHSNKEEVDEVKETYQYLNPVKQIQNATGKASAGVLSLYSSLTAIAGESAAAGVIGACAIAAGGITACYVSAHSALTYWWNWSEDVKLDKKKNLNTHVQLFNARLNELQQLHSSLQKKMQQLKEQEEKLNSSVFQMERDVPDSKVVVTIGPTGFGKSLVCNRLLGDTSKVTALAKAKDALFNVSQSGNVNSETDKLQKASKAVIIEYNEGMQNQQYCLSVVDTPGAFDSDGNDAHFQNEMAEYFTASGGVNMFCIFFKYGGKMDDNYKQMLKQYASFWGPTFWKHCVVVITRCDRVSSDEDDIEELENGVKLATKQVKKELYAISGGLVDDVVIIEFGKKNFEESTKQLLLSLADPKSVFAKKYKCDKIKSPIDGLLKSIKTMLRKYNFIHKELCVLKEKIEGSKANV